MSAQLTKQGIANLDSMGPKKPRKLNVDVSILDVCPHTETFTRMVDGDELVYCKECKDHIW